MTADSLLNLTAGDAHPRQRAEFAADDAMSLTTSTRRIMRRPEVEYRSGLKRAQLYKMMRNNEFPAARRIGARAVGWYSDEVEQWIAEREKAQR